jgi:transposase
VVRRSANLGRPTPPSHYEPLPIRRVRAGRLGAFGTVAVGNTRRRLSFFVTVLAFSRQMFVEFTVSQTMEHFLACHEHGFAALGGVPSKLMVDNLKSAVLQRLAGAAPVFNPRYLDFARHHGFAIEACNQRTARRPRLRGGARGLSRGLPRVPFKPYRG